MLNETHAITLDRVHFPVLEREDAVRPMQEHHLPTKVEGWSVLLIEVRHGRVAVCLVNRRAPNDIFYMPMIVLSPADVTREVLRLRAVVEGVEVGLS